MSIIYQLKAVEGTIKYKKCFPTENTGSQEVILGERNLPKGLLGRCIAMKFNE